MVAATESRTAPRKGGSVRIEVPVAASTIILDNVNVSFNSGGYLVNSTKTSGEKYAGVSAAYVDNSGGGNGAVKCPVWIDGLFEMNFASIAITDIGKKVYIVDNQTAIAATSTTDIDCGNIAEFISSTRAMVQIDRASAGKAA